MTVSQTEFEKIIAGAIDAIPEDYYQRIKNVVFVAEDEPSLEQRKKLKLACNQSLFGLYEGIPLTKRTNNYNLVLPDKITIFKLPIEHSTNTLEELVSQVHKTVWHEVAHYFGLDHDQIHKLDH
jgi:predicted Zn-dependent protease with MMP-like domain